MESRECLYTVVQGVPARAGVISKVAAAVCNVCNVYDNGDVGQRSDSGLSYLFAGFIEFLAKLLKTWFLPGCVIQVQQHEGVLRSADGILAWIHYP